MANSHNSKQIATFTVQYWYMSLFVTLGLVIYAYWDIVSLRYTSKFFESSDVSSGVQELIVAGFKNNLSGSMSDFLPIVVTLILASLVAYTLYNSYKFTVHDLDVHHNFVNAKRVHTLHIVAHYVAIYTAAFVLPLLFWCLYFTAIFPTLVKLPLNYIISSSTLKFSLVALSIFTALVAITQFGLVLTRLTSKILSKR